MRKFFRLAYLGLFATASASAGAPRFNPLKPANLAHLAPTTLAPKSAQRLQLIIGHAGSPLTHAENTLPGFAAALEQGANALELDLAVTKDGHVVVWHDRNPNNLNSYLRAGGLEGFKYIPWLPNVGSKWRRPVDQLTLAELREHYGYKERQKGLLRNIFKRGRRETGMEIPTFDEFAKWAETQPTLQQVYLDTKLVKGQEELAKKLAERVADATANSKFGVLFSSPSESIALTYRTWMKENRPAHPARFIFEFEKAGALEAAQKHGFDVISTGDTVLRGWKGYVEEVKKIAAGKTADGKTFSPLIGWTIDKGDKMVELIDAGATAIMTNRVAEAVRINDAKK